MRLMKWMAAIATFGFLLGAGRVEAGQIAANPAEHGTREAFRTLVDNAPPHSTIVCAGGTYDFTTGDPIRIAKPLRIIAKDPANPPVFAGNGVVGSRPHQGNNGFVVYDLKSAGSFHGLEFRNLRFKGFFRAIALVPSFDPTNETTPTDGVLSGASVVGCIFEGGRGVQIFGQGVDNFDITGNAFERSRVFIVGGAAATPIGAVYDAGRPRRGIVAENEVSDAPPGNALVAVGCEHILIRGNRVTSTAPRAGGILFGDERAASFPDDGPVDPGTVEGNEVSGPFRSGITIVGPTTLERGSILRNSVRGAGVGIMLDSGANNVLVVNNDFPGGSSVADVYLVDGSESTLPGFPAEDNTIVATDFLTTVVDHGIRTKLVGTLAPPAHP